MRNRWAGVSALSGLSLEEIAASRKAKADSLRVTRKQLRRKYLRVAKWASTKEKSELIEHLGILFLHYTNEKHSRMTFQRQVDSYKSLAEEASAEVVRRRVIERQQTRKHILGGLKTQAKSGKQLAKAKAKDLWFEWRAGKHPKIKTTEQYATEVMRLFPILKSATNIRSWSAEWGKELKARKSQSAS